MDANNYYLEIKLSISEIKKEIWDEFNKKNNNPFYEWYWIKNLERSNTVTKETGWQPRRGARIPPSPARRET